MGSSIALGPDKRSTSGCESAGGRDEDPASIVFADVGRCCLCYTVALCRFQFGRILEDFEVWRFSQGGTQTAAAGPLTTVERAQVRKAGDEKDRRCDASHAQAIVQQLR